MERSSGILMHISSLPNRFGIGSIGQCAYDFVDFLAEAKQRYWQILPLGPTGYGDSPYQLFSASAGNPYFIDLDLLVADGLLLEEEVAAHLTAPGPVDYGRLYQQRFPLLRKAFARGRERDLEAQAAFGAAQGAWLEDYALFMALKYHYGMGPFSQWPEAVRLRQPEALAQLKQVCREDVAFYRYLQYLFYTQWDALRSYAKGKGVKLMGDLPIYVSMDSADVWANPQAFQLDGEGNPTRVAGVPPDYFSKDGQLWGNPLYDWESMKAQGYAWWLERLRNSMRLYDAVRIDHFRGLESYWSVPAGEPTARNGAWMQGPGWDFIKAIQTAYPSLEVIAEDLGYLTPGVRKLLADSGYPGMKVLQFAFDSREPSDYLPHTYPRNCVCYTGTHDNTTAAGWCAEASGPDVAMARQYLGVREGEGLAWAMIRGGMGSVADLFIAQMQDYLGLGAEARMNQPGTTAGNWRWRMAPGAASPALARRIARYTWMYGRCRQ